MILVTGGTGLVGAHLLAFLLRDTTPIKAIYRSEDSLKKAKKVCTYYFDDAEKQFNRIDWIKTDINDITALDKAFTDVKKVYHCAALISFDPKDFPALQKTNIEGTSNIVNACLEHNIEKLCYVSSIAALGEYEDAKTPISEETYWNPEAENNVYAISKYGAEMEVWRATQEGLNAVIVNPGVILGAGFWYSGSGALFYKIKKGMRYFTNGVSGYVDVQDVVKIMIALMESDIKSERYIAVAENWSFKDFSYETAKQLQVNPPKKEASSFLLSIAWRLDWLRSKVTGKQRRFTKNLANSAKSTSYYDNSKVKEALGFTFTPLQETISRVCAKFV